MSTRIRKFEPADHAEWLRMRCALWPDCPLDEHHCEMANLMSRLAEQAVFVAVRPSGGLGGFVEVSLRSAALGVESGPVGFVEGWFVDPDIRREGIGRLLIEAAEEWARERGCVEMASDTPVDNTASIAAHRAVGYQDTEHLVHFRKALFPRGPNEVADGSGI